MKKLNFGNIWKITVVVNLLLCSGCGSSGSVSAAYEAEKSEAVEMDVDEYVESDEYYDWMTDYYEKRDASLEYKETLTPFYAKLIACMVEEEGNSVFSPLNLLMAFGSIAECADGNTRSQILDAMGMDLETLRDAVNAVYLSNDFEMPLFTSRLSGALFLNENETFKDDCLTVLRDTYHMSSYIGDLGSSEMNNTLHAWLNEATGNLLKDSVNNISLDSSITAALCTAVYYRNSWMEEFEESETSTETFHGLNGDTEVEMMHLTEKGSLYEAEGFTVRYKGLSEAGSVMFVLPPEGMSLKEAAESEIMEGILMGKYNDSGAYYVIHQNIPKVEVEGSQDLLSVMEQMGITDLSDLSALSDNASLDSAEHHAVLKMDEKGIEGAAFTMMLSGAAMTEPEERDFTLDRPFLMLVKAQDGSIVFACAVNDAE